MITFTFQLKITGPAHSGKSTFIKFVEEACAQSVSWAAVRAGPHMLDITNIRPPTPEGEEMVKIKKGALEVKEL